jgi:hypothetical protein
MKKTVLGFSLILIGLIVSISILNSPTKAEEAMNLAIKSDGSIEPNTNLIEKNGSVYILKDDIVGAIKVETGYITIDGQGHTMQANNSYGVISLKEGATLRTHILIKNLKISQSDIGIVTGCSDNNSLIGNYFDDTSILLHADGKFTGDLIKHNTFKNTGIIIDYDKLGNDVITENNFIGDSGLLLWMTSTSPIVDRNYWSNYTTKYPNAKEVNASGIWDTPYVVDALGGTIIDEHPLVHPITEFEIADFNIPIITPTPYYSSPSPSSTAGSNVLSNQTFLISIVSLVVIIVVSVSLVYFKKRRGKP